MRTALVTGASRGLGLALARTLVGRGWALVLDARDGAALEDAATSITTDGPVVTSTAPVRVVPGDVADPRHRERLAAAVEALGGLDLLVSNASSLGPTPLPPLAEVPAHALTELLEVNTVAPLALLQAVLPWLRESRGTVVDVTSDVAVEAVAGWGAYGASKAALDQLSAVLALEHPELAVYAFDPGDMRTAMHQAAFPGEDISDRPDPRTVVPALLRLVDDRPPSGRYRASDLLAAEAAVVGGHA